MISICNTTAAGPACCLSRAGCFQLPHTSSPAPSILQSTYAEYTPTAGMVSLFLQQPQAPDAGESVLDRFTNDLTQAARRNQLDPLVGRDSELRRLTHILLRRTKNNPVLIGESGGCLVFVWGVGGGGYSHWSHVVGVIMLVWAVTFSGRPFWWGDGAVGGGVNWLGG